ncbi:MAG: phosphate acetyltransferase [Clostridiales Family XIII bacterium]|jgi:phosphate acetyltransferase|nr:phosphate acetyltransferase [Clostridiales Family XIII bacterium]
MSGLIDRLVKKATESPKRVALPECDAPNTLLAAEQILRQGVGYPVLIGSISVIEDAAAQAGVPLEGMDIEDIEDEAVADALIDRYMESGEKLLSAKSYRRKIKDPVYYAMVLEAVGDVDVTFCGHTNTTGDVLMAAQNVIGLQEGVDVPSIFALLETPGFEGPEGDTIVFTDCGLNPEPTAGQLASIAIASCDNISALLGWEPRAAFLSFSTDGSGSSASTELIKEALAIAHNRRPDLKIDGEFQLDTAIDPKVAAGKLKRHSDVAGRANILVFPDLDAANIAIKLVQRFAGGSGYGHTLSGFKKPVADSSRGATVEEMVGDIAMLVIAASGAE